MTRIELQSRETQPDHQHVWDMLERERQRPNSNIFRAIANLPDVLDRFIPMANAIRDAGGLDAELRELVIIMTCLTIGSSYEEDRHWNIAVRMGVSKDKLAAIWGFEHSSHFDEREKAVLRLARQTARAPAQVSEDVWRDVERHLGSGPALAVLFTVGWYKMTACVTGPLDLDDEPGFTRL
ncbi:Carboxymuconolactone decarboxylase [Sphingomonas paucimobilis]|nr:Carboxymuconolactone decarboxylase [Sphingomonas paucimobilis]